MDKILLDEAWEDLEFWAGNDRRALLKIFALVNDIARNPFTGIGKPEPLKHELSGCWSRRITPEHRLIYRVEDGAVVLIKCRYHYD